MAGSAYPLEIPHAIRYPSWPRRCATCRTDFNVVCQQHDGWGDYYVTDCAWCLPMHWNHEGPAALRADGVWLVSRHPLSAYDLPELPAGAQWADPDWDVELEWARRWVDQAAWHPAIPPLPDDAIDRFVQLRSTSWPWERDWNPSPLTARWITWIIDHPQLDIDQLRIWMYAHKIRTVRADRHGVPRPTPHLTHYW